MKNKYLYCLIIVLVVLIGTLVFLRYERFENLPGKLVSPSPTTSTTKLVSPSPTATLQLDASTIAFIKKSYDILNQNSPTNNRSLNTLNVLNQLSGLQNDPLKLTNLNKSINTSISNLIPHLNTTLQKIIKDFANNNNIQL